MNKVFLILLVVSATSCKRLESDDFFLTQGCSSFDRTLIDSLSALQIDGLHYIAVDTNDCVLTVKYEKEKVDQNIFLDYLVAREYLRTELEIDSLE